MLTSSEMGTLDLLLTRVRGIKLEVYNIDTQPSVTFGNFRKIYMFLAHSKCLSVHTHVRVSSVRHGYLGKIKSQGSKVHYAKMLGIQKLSYYNNSLEVLIRNASFVLRFLLNHKLLAFEVVSIICINIRNLNICLYNQLLTINYCMGIYLI